MAEEGPQSPALWANILALAFSDLREAILKGDDEATTAAQNRIVVLVLTAASVGMGGYLIK